jgi:hypothetical protein
MALVIKSAAQPPFRLWQRIFQRESLIKQRVALKMKNGWW